jgi:acyl-CoA synthetase (AMP-forming)/AMP-acid ligase II
MLPRFSARAFIEAIGRHRCTWLTGVPTMLALALQEPAALAATDRSSVRRVTIGSAPLTQALIDRIKAAFPGAQTPAEVIVKGNEYYVVRERETYNDLIRGEKLPRWLE